MLKTKTLSIAARRSQNKATSRLGAELAIERAKDHTHADRHSRKNKMFFLDFGFKEKRYTPKNSQETKETK
jgi:hypothetical protein